MGFQSSINVKQAFGVPGDFYDDSPRTVAPAIVESGTVSSVVSPVVVGGAVSFKDITTNPAIVVPGGTAFAGIAVGSKQYVNYSGLDATLSLKDGSIADICTEGHIVVKSVDAVVVGYQAQYNTTTGEIGAVVAGGTASDGFALIPNSKYVLVNAEANGLAVLELNR